MTSETETQESNLSKYGKEALYLLMQGMIIGLGGIIANKAVNSLGRRSTSRLAETSNNVLEIQRSKVG